MKPASADRGHTTSGVTRRQSFGIAKKNFAWIKGILRDKIYKDKILAVLREYAANARDAHMMPGGWGGNVPFLVHLPTSLEPYLLIRDYGPGLSEEDVYTVFTEYGESTKRQGNDSIGMFGIGSKSAFAYSDQFTVTSWHKGVKSVYNATLTDDDDEMLKLGEWPTEQPSGIEIRVPVRHEDIEVFRIKAEGLFPHFDPLPKINIPLPKRSEVIRKHGFLEERNLNLTGQGAYVPYGGKWVAVMGCIPYPVDPSQICAELTELDLWRSVQRINGGLHLSIGDVDIAASREELEYTDRTKTALARKFQALMEEFSEEAVANVQSTSLSPWAKRIRSVYLRDTLGLPFPRRWLDWCQQRVLLVENQTVPLLDDQGNPMEKDGTPLVKEVQIVPEKFTLRSGDLKVTTIIPIREDQTVWVRDTRNHLSGYRCFNANQVALVPKAGVEPDDAIAEFQEWAKKLGLEGIPVVLLSKQMYTPNSNGRTPNKKYSRRSFRLKDGVVSSGKSALSDNWTVVKREPHEEDVFVILSHFKRVSVKGSGSADLYYSVTEDRGLAESLGLVYPPIYGYKYTEKRPVKAADCVGTEWGEWRKKFWRESINSSHLRMVAQWHWSQVINTGWVQKRWQDPPIDTGAPLAAAVELLGADHPVTEFVANHLHNRSLVEKGRLLHVNMGAYTGRTATTRDDRKAAIALNAKWEAIGKLAKNLARNSRRRSTAEIAQDNLYKRYPLLRQMPEGFLTLKSETGPLWIEYIQMVDTLSKKK